MNEAVVLCCRKKEARVWSVGKLKSLPGSDVIYYGADCHGGDRRVNGLENEDDVLHDCEEDEENM